MTKTRFVPMLALMLVLNAQAGERFDVSIAGKSAGFMELNWTDDHTLDVHFEFNGGSLPPSATPDPHCFHSEGDAGHALVEGWADYVGEITDNEHGNDGFHTPIHNTIMWRGEEGSPCPTGPFPPPAPSSPLGAWGRNLASTRRRTGRRGSRGYCRSGKV